jgi:predicted DNA-binding protein with PD1-like motif
MSEGHASKSKDHMEIARRGPFVILRLDHGADVLESVKLAVKNEQSTMVIITGLGMITEFELGYFDRGTYIKKSFDEPHELLAMQGTVSSKGEPRIHIHATVADKGHMAFGGHLMRGKVWMSNEICMARLEGLPSTRSIDPAKKVGILHLDA